MTYELRVKASAERQLRNLPDGILKRIHEKILALAEEPRLRGCAKLTGLEAYRIRIGSYRVLYTVDDTHQVVEIAVVEHRRAVYRRRR